MFLLGGDRLPLDTYVCRQGIPVQVFWVGVPAVVVVFFSLNQCWWPGLAKDMSQQRPWLWGCAAPCARDGVTHVDYYIAGTGGTGCALVGSAAGPPANCRACAARTGGARLRPPLLAPPWPRPTRGHVNLPSSNAS